MPDAVKWTYTAARPAVHDPHAMASSVETARMLRAILLGGLAAGIGDSVLALVLYRVSLVRIYQSVASGLLGRPSFEGGLPTAALVMVLHFLLATTTAVVSGS